MKFAEFIELDRQLRRANAGASLSDWGRLERDRESIRRAREEVSNAPGGDEALLRAWTTEMSQPEEPSIGPLLTVAIRWTALLLTVLGGVVGAGAAGALLRYDGSQPINVLFFLGTIVGVQLLLLPLLILGLLVRRRFPGLGRVVRGLVGGLWMHVVSRLSRLGVSPEQAAAVRADLGELRQAHSLFSRVQPLVIGCLVQTFGVAFNLGAVATLLILGVFSDLSFSWGTTVRVEPSEIHQLTSWIAAPWSGWLPEARPSVELVEATRYDRLAGTFVHDSGSAPRAGGWWLFLLAATVTYGLLPRIVALAIFLLLVRREIRRALVRSTAVRELRERLATPVVTIGSGSPVTAESEGAEPAARDGEGHVRKGLELAVVFWAYDEVPPESVVARILEQRVGAKGGRRFEAGGLEESDAGVLTGLKEAQKAGDLEGVAIFFEPFEPPKADVRRFLTRVREALGPSLPIVVLLAEVHGEQVVPVEATDRAAWSRAIAAMGDPFIVLEETRAS